MSEKKYAYAYEEYYSNKKEYCPYCDTEIEENTIVCPECGKQIEMLNALKEEKETVIIEKPLTDPGRKVDKWVSFVLCFFFGFLGIHKFYEGRYVQGLLYLFTVGWFGMAWLCDIFIILFKPNPYYIQNKNQKASKRYN